MEPTNQTNREAYEYVKRITNPIFKKVLQEPKKNRISVRGSVSVSPEKCLYNPHNCRAYFDFKKSGKKAFKVLKTDTPSGCTHKIVNSTEHSFKNFFSCTIRVRTNTIEIGNMLNPRWHCLEVTTKAGDAISKIVWNKIEESKKIIKEFIKIFGGFSNFDLINLVLKDNKIQGLDILEKIPQEYKFSNRVGKKEYGENLFELKSPLQTSNLLENLAVLNVAPQLAEELRKINKKLDPQGDKLKLLKARCKTVADVLDCNSLMHLLTQAELEDFSLWTFKNVV